jgi:hypothetical protein
MVSLLQANDGSDKFTLNCVPRNKATTHGQGRLKDIFSQEVETVVSTYEGLGMLIKNSSRRGEANHPGMAELDIGIRLLGKW